MTVPLDDGAEYGFIGRKRIDLAVLEQPEGDGVIAHVDEFDVGHDLLEVGTGGRGVLADDALRPASWRTEVIPLDFRTITA